MSDLVAGTVIGGCIGILGAVLGFFIHGYYSRKNTEMQINARKEEQLNQINCQREEMRIKRLIELRTQYLDPMVKHVTKCHELLRRINEDVVQISDRYGDPPSPEKSPFLQFPGCEDYHGMIDNLEEKRDELFASIYKIKVLMCNSGDLQLHTMVNDSTAKINQACNDIWNLRQLALLWEAPRRNGESKVSLQVIGDKLTDAERSLSNIHARIEELLTTNS